MEPLYNTANPSSLLAAGYFEGQGINLDPSSLEPVAQGRLFRGRFRDASRQSLSLNGGVPGLVAVKATEQSNDRQPRNLRREALILASCRHPHILPLMNAYLQPSDSPGDIPKFLLFTSYYPTTLRDLVASQLLTPDEMPRHDFDQLTQSWAWQLIRAVHYLHLKDIAHRDVSPNNVLVSRGGRIVLADFGIAIRQRDEPPGQMQFEVGTGAYRAPELLFGSKSYDAAAIDIWATAATLSELFTPFEPPTPTSSPEFTDDEQDTGGSSFSVQDWAAKLGIKVNVKPRRAEARRRALYGESRSDLALVGAIFKARGTPTTDSWPEAATLPDWGRFDFNAFPGTPLSQLLPHLDSSSPLIKHLDGMMQYSVRKRIEAFQSAASGEGWKGVRLVAPTDFSDDELREWPHESTKDGKSLESILAPFL